MGMLFVSYINEHKYPYHMNRQANKSPDGLSHTHTLGCQEGTQLIASARETQGDNDKYVRYSKRAKEYTTFRIEMCNIVAF